MAHTIPNAAACGLCLNYLASCTCTAESLATAEKYECVACSNCGQARPFKGFDDCLACTVAYLLHDDPQGIDEVRRSKAGTYWLALFNAEVERQLAATIAA